VPEKVVTGLVALPVFPSTPLLECFYFILFYFILFYFILFYF